MPKASEAVGVGGWAREDEWEIGQIRLFLNNETVANGLPRLGVRCQPTLSEVDRN